MVLLDLQSSRIEYPNQLGYQNFIFVELTLE